ncbi:receptor expression-enhancing protein 5-like [Rhopilema esculentum]|uniref:receptor expression-enhancing protein 5-like n=1 Tax=Rhopilema esculentum TaxID=499914 RepID=UPI0031D532F6
MLEKLKENYQKLKDYVQQVCKLKLYFQSGLDYAETKAGCKWIYLLSGFVAISAVLLAIGLATIPLIMIGYIYPVIASFRAIGSNRRDEYTQWLMYWIVLSGFGACEMMTMSCISYVPLYSALKLIVCVWCMLPYDWNGGTYIFNRLQYLEVFRNNDELHSLLQTLRLRAIEVLDDESDKLHENADNLQREGDSSSKAGTETGKADSVIEEKEEMKKQERT